MATIKSAKSPKADKSVPTRFRPVQQQFRDNDPARDKINVLLTNEVVLVLTDSYFANTPWEASQRQAAIRYARVLTHSEAAHYDYSALTEDQMWEIQVIFMVICHVKRNGILCNRWKSSTTRKIVTQDITLVGMEADWYTENIGDVVEKLKAAGTDVHYREVLKQWRQDIIAERLAADKPDVSETVSDAVLIEA